MKRIPPLLLLAVVSPVHAETAEQLRRAEEVGTMVLQAVLILAVLAVIAVFYFSVLSRLGQIRDANRTQTKLLQQIVDLQKVQLQIAKKQNEPSPVVPPVLN